MTAKIINGKEISENILNNLKAKVGALSEKPSLAVIIVGEDPASKVYVKNKVKKALDVGFTSILKELREETTKEELLNLIEELNNDPSINGVLLQLPLPKHLNEEDFLDKILPKKDVDGFNSYNVGKLAKNQKPYAISCTPKGIMKILEVENIDVKGKNVVVIGRSNIVGKPMAALLTNQDATVTLAHSRTKNLGDITKQADIIISATGKIGLLKADMVSDGAVVIDVGIVRDSSGKLIGDVDYCEVQKKASYITPVPGGVGPMTIAMLLENTYELFEVQKGV